jgi:general secretion pathway protein F/type IV pilus assembly protein PilC
MPTYSYIARTMQGGTVQGVLTADTENAALRQLDDQSLFPLEISEGGEAKAMFGGRKRVRAGTVAVMYSQLADLLRAGVPALRSLDVLCRQTPNKTLAEILREVREDLAGGKTLADAMAQHPNAFPELHTSMIRAGEKGGFLEDVLARIAAFTERQNELRSKIIGSMIYPIVLVCVGTGIVTFIMVWLVPQIRGFLRGDLPLITRFLFGSSDFIQQYYPIIFPSIFGLIALVVYLVRNESTRAYMDRLSLSVPFIGPILKVAAICRFCRILGTLLNNGVPILQSLKISRDSAGNTILMDQIDEATEAVRKGQSLAQPLGAGGFFPLDLVDMISVGEESNNLEDVLVKVADSYESRLGRRIDLVVRMIEPFMLMIMAGVVAFIAIGLLVPILTMSTSGR